LVSEFDVKLDALVEVRGFGTSISGITKAVDVVEDPESVFWSVGELIITNALFIVDEAIKGLKSAEDK
jgi:hypothetical protein